MSKKCCEKNGTHINIREDRLKLVRCTCLFLCWICYSQSEFMLLCILLLLKPLYSLSCFNSYFRWVVTVFNAKNISFWVYETMPSRRYLQKFYETSMSSQVALMVKKVNVPLAMKLAMEPSLECLVVIITKQLCEHV